MSKYTVPDWDHIAMITIDMQNDFSLQGAPFEIKGTHNIIPNMIKILNTCRYFNIPIIHVVRIYQKDGSNADISRRELIHEGNEIVLPYFEGADLVRALKPEGSVNLMYEKLLHGRIQKVGDFEWVIYKPRWGAFYHTKLDSFLRNKLNINTIVFTGCNFPNCPRTSIYEASERDYRILLITDAVSGLYKRGESELENIGVTLNTTTAFTDTLRLELSKKYSA